MAERFAVPGWVPPSALQRKRILDDTRSIAIVGASANPSRASNFVATYLLSTAKAYTLYLVNPRETEILGQPVYPSLQDLPEVPDMVDATSAMGAVDLGASSASAAAADEDALEELGLEEDDRSACLTLSLSLTLTLTRTTPGRP